MGRRDRSFMSESRQVTIKGQGGLFGALIKHGAMGQSVDDEVEEVLQMRNVPLWSKVFEELDTLTSQGNGEPEAMKMLFDAIVHVAKGLFCDDAPHVDQAYPR